MSVCCSGESARQYVEPGSHKEEVPPLKEDMPAARTFGQSPDLVIPDNFNAPLPNDELASWDAALADAPHAQWETDPTMPTPEIEALVQAVWPTQSKEPRFRVLAEDLLQARDAAGAALPSATNDPLAVELADRIAAKVAAIAKAVDQK